MKKDKKKILLILTILMPTKHHFQRLGVNIDSKDIIVKYWNLLPIINLNYFNIIKDSRHVKKNHKFTFIASYKQLFAEIKKLPKNFYFSDYAGNFLLIIILKKILEKKGGTNILIDLGAQLNISINKISVLKFYIKKKIYYLLLKKIFFYSIQKIIDTSINMFFRTKPKIIFASDLFSYQKYKNKFKTSNIFKINGADFQNYLNLKKKGIGNQKKYITYLDTAFDENFDYQLRRFKYMNLSPFNFWKKINFFLDKMKSLYPHKSIMIAAHPNRFKNNAPSKYKSNYNQSAILVGKSDFVITTYSLSAAYAVLFDKPLILIYSNSFNDQIFERSASIDFYKKNLGVKSINIDKINSISKKNLKNLRKYSYSKKKYKKYKDYYLGFPNIESQGGSWSKIYKCLSNLDFRL